MSKSKPFIYRHILLDQLTPIAVYTIVKEMFPQEITFLFESGITNESGNTSFIAIGARERVWHKNSHSFYQNETGDVAQIDSNPLLFLKNYYHTVDYKAYQEMTQEASIGFIDGFIGFVGYDMAREFEPVLQKTMAQLNDLYPNASEFDFIRPKMVLAYSHKTSRLTLASTMPEMEESLEKLVQAFHSPYTPRALQPAQNVQEGFFEFSKERFFEMVEKSKEMIRSGDVFQILMSNRYIRKAVVDPLSFYRILRTKNPSPYMYLLDFNHFAIAGSSPEVMVRLSNGQILLRPIAGTRKRGRDHKRDKELETEMLEDPKERSEHIMLVDLGRNDVGRVAKSGTVRVEALMRVERYSHVMHMVSDVVADLDNDKDMFDLFMAVFTAGTMTGAPKIRAMELIAQFEGIKRGFYSGSIGYFGFDGNMDSAITIRSAYIDEEKIVCHAGAGVVADSQNELEYLEVQNKLAATMSSLDDLVALES